MRIVGRNVLDDAAKRHSEWRASLNAWLRIVAEASWRYFADVRSTRKDADGVGKYVIFNIAQNRARLISMIYYEQQAVVVVKVLDHASYDREDFE